MWFGGCQELVLKWRGEGAVKVRTRVYGQVDVCCM